MKRVNYYTHAGFFHTDELAGYNICKLAGLCTHVVRLEKTDDIPTDGYVGDIGGIYDPENRMFDHHQGFIKRENNGYYYATAGLYWKHYGAIAVGNVIGEKLTKSNKAFLQSIADRVDVTLIMGIDAHDIDPEYYVQGHATNGEVKVHSLSKTIAAFNTKPFNDKETQFENFTNAANFFEIILKNEINEAKEFVINSERFEDIAEITGEIAILSERILWREIVHEKYPNLKFVIAPSLHPSSKLALMAVPIHPDRRTLKIPIEKPEWFLKFVHPGKFMAGGDSIQELKRLAKYNIINQ